MSAEPSTPTGEAGDQAPRTEQAMARSQVPTASVAMLKALAHPVRQQLFRALAARGHARATDLAADLDLPINQISFHLRVLADAEIITEAPEHARDKRDRVWTMRERGWEIGNPEHPVADVALGGAVTQWVAADMHAMIQRLVAWAPEYTTGRTSEVHGTLTASALWLTEEDFSELTDQLGEVLDAFRARRKAGDEGVRHWQLGVIATDDQI